MTRVDFSGYAMKHDEHEIKDSRHQLARHCRASGAHIVVTKTDLMNSVKFTGTLQNKAAQELMTHEIGLMVDDYMFGGHIEVDRDNDTFSGEYWID